MIKNMPPVILDLFDSNLHFLPVAGKVILNYGSSTPPFWRKDQPFIYSDLIYPLEQRGAFVLHYDPKGAPGILNSTIELPWDWFNFIMLNSVLEHVNSVEDVLDDVYNLLHPDNGYLIVSCPSEWPYHPDPIDNMLRIKNKEEWEFLLGDRFHVSDFKEVTDPRGKETIVLAEKNA